MNYIIYLLTYPIIWLFSKLPFGILYLISDGIYVLLYYFIGYRKKVVISNLKTVFPTKTDAEVKQITKQFYKHFVDIFIEMIKSFTISKEEIMQRYTYTNLEMLNNLYEKGRSCIVVGAHYANWEWSLGLSQLIKHKGYAAFTTIGNPYFNEQIKKSRGRFGVTLLPTKEVISQVKMNKTLNIPSVYGLLSDQSPSLRKTFYWTNFFNVKVPVHTGAEMLVKRYDLDLIYMSTKKIKRGHYQNTFTMLNNGDPKKYADYELTDIFLKKVENDVYAQPEFYFWTHKRFKHKNKAPKL